MLTADRPRLLAALSSHFKPFTTNLSDSLFGDVLLCVLQALASATRCLTLPTPRDSVLNALARAALPLRASLLPSHKRSTLPQLPGVSRSVLQAEVGAAEGRSAGLSERNLACLGVPIAAAMFLAGMLGSSWFPVLECFRTWITSLRRAPCRPAWLNGLESQHLCERGRALTEWMVGAGQQRL
jgi:hypothetical protein